MKFRTLTLILAVSGIFLFAACSKKVALTVQNDAGQDLAVAIGQQVDSESALPQTLFDGMILNGEKMVITLDEGYIQVSATGNAKFAPGTVEAKQQFTSGGFTAKKVTATINPAVLNGPQTAASNAGTIIFSEK